MAITVHEAIRKVAALQPYLQVVGVSDSLDAWIIGTGFPGEVVPGQPMYLVKKETGDTCHMAVADDNFWKYMPHAQDVEVEDILLPYQDSIGKHAS
ncbi:hypothetical protein [Bifidobacterium cuniculi]|uniref:Uncharacterized protein n=1 Tax=Bifidobacterium cuniculi TaxID=1688 RepID=A0A087AT62_9BIFI|nr:hypothetical protein [Bifidobacterium cuniculi]KFI61962.1 hypothetical protein BCUN_1804 [Bifidobacterium cuniculi]